MNLGLIKRPIIREKEKELLVTESHKLLGFG